ncbi:MAG: zinc finger protein [Pseudonocardiaceae bacterium]
MPSNQGVTLVFTVVPAPYPESHPFVWFPLAGQRHAIDRRDRNVPFGSPMRTLCGGSYPRGPDGDMEWLWITCEPCWDAACKIVGIRPRRRAALRAGQRRHRPPRDGARDTSGRAPPTT